MVEEVKDTNPSVQETGQVESSAGQSTSATEESKIDTKPKAELLCFGAAKQSGGLQKNFERFRKAKKEEIQYRNYMAAQS